LPRSHLVSLVYAQLTHSLSLNDVCDGLRFHAGPLSVLRGVTASTKNALSHANRERNPQMAEAVFWTMLAELPQLHPGCGARRRSKFAFRSTKTGHDAGDDFDQRTERRLCKLGQTRLEGHLGEAVRMVVV